MMSTKSNSVEICSFNPKTRMSESEKMMACTFHSSKNVVMEMKPRPMITDPSDCVVRVSSTSICGSDLFAVSNSSMLSGGSLKKGDILGQEAMGVVVEVGSDCKNVKLGDKVVISSCMACGKCEFCKKKEFQMCDTTNCGQMYGACCGMGMQCEFVRVPFADINLLPVPKEMPPHMTEEKIVLISDTACTAFHACEITEMKPEDCVMVFGCGPLGMMCCMWAKYRGVKRVICVDAEETRLAKCAVMGCEIVNTRKTEDLVMTCVNMCMGGPDVIIDCMGCSMPTGLMSGVMQKIEQTIGMDTGMDMMMKMCKIIRKGGRMALMGDCYSNQFPMGCAMEKCIKICGGRCCVQKYWNMVLRCLMENKVDPSGIITHRMPFEKVCDAYKMCFEHPDQCMKIVLNTRPAMGPIV